MKKALFELSSEELLDEFDKSAANYCHVDYEYDDLRQELLNRLENGEKYQQLCD